MIKYLLLLCILITVPSYGVKGKRKELKSLEIEGVIKVALSGEYYKRRLQKALAECVATCKTIEESEYISKYGYAFLKRMLEDISVSQCSRESLSQKYYDFTEFVSVIIRKINPSLYDQSFTESLDDVNEAFLSMQDQKEKEKKRVRVRR